MYAQRHVPQNYLQAQEPGNNLNVQPSTWRYVHMMDYCGADDNHVDKELMTWGNVPDTKWSENVVNTLLTQNDLNYNQPHEKQRKEMYQDNPNYLQKEMKMPGRTVPGNAQPTPAAVCATRCVKYITRIISYTYHLCSNSMMSLELLSSSTDKKTET